MSFQEFFYKYFWFIFGFIVTLMLIGLLYFASRKIKQIRNRLIVRIRESETRTSEYIANIKDTYFTRKNKEGKNEKYFLHKNAFYELLKGVKKIICIDFIAGIELPFISWYDSATGKVDIEFLGANALDAVIEQKLIVEQAEMGQDKSWGVKEIIMIVVVVAVVVIGGYMLATGKIKF